MVIAGQSPGGRPLRRRRELVFDLWRTAPARTAAPPRPPPIIVAATGWSLLANPLEGVRSVGAVNWCLICGAQRQPGLLPPKATTDHRHEREQTETEFKTQKLRPLTPNFSFPDSTEEGRISPPVWLRS